MFTKVSALALFAAVAAAVHAPVGDPEGNPITRPLNEVVPACKPFSISWTPTTPNTVSILLLRGPSTNVVPIGTIAEGIANSGTFEWTPEASLEADTTHYGLQLIDDVTGQYQYSTQFGISKDDCKDSPSATPSGYPSPSETPTGYSTPASVKPAANSTTFCTTTTVYVGTSSYVHSTGAPVVNSTVVLPTKSMTVPESLKPTATAPGYGPTTTAPAQATGAASALKAGFGLAGAVAGLVFML